MTNAIIDGIRVYFDTCPVISALATRVKVDFLKDQNRSFSIEPIPIDPVIEEYLDGIREKRYRFSLMVKFPYSEEAKLNIENNAVFEKIARWIEEQNDIEHLPEMPIHCYPEAINVISTGALLQVTPDWKVGRYQMIMELIYIEKTGGQI